MRAAALLLLALASAGCSGPSFALKKSLDARLAAQDYAGAARKLEAAKESQYGPRNAVLYHLDLGMVLHNAGKYKESDEHLAKAESRMNELYTKSLHKMAEVMVINDAAMPYAGEPFERALTNVLRALNYVFLGQPDEALVEARKVEVFLDELYRNQEKKPSYKDDAFARYLDSLLYEDAGQADDARISREAALRAYSWYASAYRTPAPEFSLPALAGDPGGELVFIHYNGVAPRKISRTFQVAWNRAIIAVQSSGAGTDEDVELQEARNALRAGILGRSITISYPEYVQDPFVIAASEVQVGDATGRTQLMEDLAAIAVKDLKDRVGLVKLRSIARAAVKYILAAAAAKEIRRSGAGKVGEWLADAAVDAAAAGSETADVRSWTTMPAQILMARLRVAPGTYPVTVRCRNASGAVVSTRTFDAVTVKKGKRTYLQYRTAS